MALVHPYQAGDGADFPVVPVLALVLAVEAAALQAGPVAPAKKALRTECLRRSDRLAAQRRAQYAGGRVPDRLPQ